MEMMKCSLKIFCPKWLHLQIFVCFWVFVLRVLGTEGGFHWTRIVRGGYCSCRMLYRYVSGVYWSLVGLTSIVASKTREDRSMKYWQSCRAICKDMMRMVDHWRRKVKIAWLKFWHMLWSLALRWCYAGLVASIHQVDTPVSIGFNWCQKIWWAFSEIAKSQWTMVVRCCSYCCRKRIVCVCVCLCVPCSWSPTWDASGKWFTSEFPLPTKVQSS